MSATRTGLLILALSAICANEFTHRLRQLNSPHPQVRAAAVKRLGELGDRRAVPRLIPLLKQDTVVLVRFETALALGKLRDEAAIPPLTAAAETDPSPDVMLAATKALAEFGPKAFEPLIKLLYSRLSAVRLLAARELGRLRATSAVKPLIERLNDPDPGVRKAAIYALRRIGTAEAMEAVARMLSRPDRELESAAEEALSGTGYEADLEELRRLLRKYR